MAVMLLIFCMGVSPQVLLKGHPPYFPQASTWYLTSETSQPLSRIAFISVTLSRILCQGLAVSVKLLIT